MRLRPSSPERNWAPELAARAATEAPARALVPPARAPSPLREGEARARAAERASNPSARLRACWDRGSVPSVHDGELEAGVDALIEHLSSKRFFGAALEGMDRVSFSEAGLGYEIQLAPHRNAPRAESKGRDGCVLCIDPSSPEARLAWRDYWVRANHFPYVPAERRHVMLLPREHRLQSCSREVLGDVLDFHAALGGRRAAVTFYNGLAGNSQYHLHWHALYDRTPLERALDGGRLELRRWRSSPRGSLSTYEGGPYAGLLVEGSKAYVLDWTLRLTERLDRDPRTSLVDAQGARAGTYNLALLAPRGGRHRMVVIPRRASCLRPEVEGAGPYPYGAYVLVGVFIHDGERATETLADAAKHAARETVVPPSELDWLPDLVREPESRVLLLRARSHARVL